MRKILNKILCFTVITASVAGAAGFSACGAYNVKPLPGYVSTQDKAQSNGGFAVGKGDYVYFINGREANTADNTYGKAVKGAIMRISKSNLAARNYSAVDTVVPQIAYSGNNDAGIFVYGDYVYYSTPSTELNSDGVVQNSHLAFKSAKLDGTQANQDYFVQYSDNTIDYRYVEDNGTVYLIYVAKNENLYGTSCTNIHSVNTKTGENTLLAYNVGSYIFDKADLTNPRIYYTMTVTDFVRGTSWSDKYNQIWTVTPDGATPNEYNFDGVEDYDADKDPLYVNCGDLVFDGIGKVEGMTSSVTQFNSSEEGVASVERSAYKYTLSKYENGTLFYTRTSTQNDSVMLFAEKESSFISDNAVSAEWKPVAGNPQTAESLLGSNSSAANNYVYLYDANGDVEEVLIAGTNGLVKAVVTEDGKIPTIEDNSGRYLITKDGQATVLNVDTENKYIYYSLSGGNGYSVNRIKYDGGYYDYNGLAVTEGVNEYTSVKILDLDSASDWYKPEFIEGQILFPTETVNMTEYDYIMVCDLHLRNGEGLMTNEQIDKLNDKFEGISEEISEIDSSVYNLLPDTLRYVYYTGDKDYIDKLAKAFDELTDYTSEKYGDKYLLSEGSLEKLADFVNATGDWAEYADKISVNGKDVKANNRDYYYTLLGKMNDADAEAYLNGVRSSYLKEYPEQEKSWFEGLSTGAKVGFIVGVCLGGLLVIGGAVAVTLIVLRKRKKQLPVYKKRIKVDTTDDKNIDVYSDEARSPENDGGEDGGND